MTFEDRHNDEYSACFAVGIADYFVQKARVSSGEKSGTKFRRAAIAVRPLPGGISEYHKRQRSLSPMQHLLVANWWQPPRSHHVIYWMETRHDSAAPSDLESKAERRSGSSPVVGTK